jgi:hypothetical protein
MSNLLKSTQGISFLITFLICICQSVATDVYLFDRDLESRELRFASKNEALIMCSDPKDPVCLNPPIFSFPTFLSPIYQVLEYHDYLNYHELVLNKTNNGSFTVMDSRNQTWYLVHHGELKPLKQALDDLENVQLSVLYYTDIFFDFPNAKLYTMGAATAAIIATTLAMILTFVYMCKSMCDEIHDNIICSLNYYQHLLGSMYLPWFFWMLSSTLFLGTIFIRIVAIKSKGDVWGITVISTMADWDSTGFIIWFIIALGLERRRVIIGNTPSGLAIHKNPSKPLNLCLLHLPLILPLAPSLMIVIIYLFDATIFGPDDASLLTGYSCISTLMGSFDRTRFM